MLDLSKFNNQIGLGVSTPQVSDTTSPLWKEVSKLGGQIQESFVNLWDKSLQVERTATVSDAKIKTEDRIQKEYDEKIKTVNSKGNITTKGENGEDIDTGESFDEYMSKFSDEAINESILTMKDSATKRMFHETIDATNFAYKSKAFVDKNKKISDFARINVKAVADTAVIELQKSNPNSLVENTLRSMDKVKTSADTIRQASGLLEYENTLREERNKVAVAATQTMLSHASAIEGMTTPASQIFGVPLAFKDFAKFKAYMQEFNPDLADKPEFQQALQEMWNAPVDGQAKKLHEEVGKHLTPEQYRNYLNQFLNIKFKKQEQAKIDMSNEWKQTIASAGLPKNYSEFNKFSTDSVSRTVQQSLANGMDTSRIADNLAEVAVNSEIQNAVTRGVNVSPEEWKSYNDRARAKHHALVAQHLGEEGLNLLKERKITGGAAFEKGYERFQKERRMYAIKMNSNPFATALTDPQVQQYSSALSRALIDPKEPITNAINAFNNLEQITSKIYSKAGVPRIDNNLLADNIADNIAFSLNTEEGKSFLNRIKSTPPNMKSKILTQLVNTGKINHDQATLISNETIAGDEIVTSKINDILKQAHSPKTKTDFMDISKAVVGKSDEQKKKDENKMNDLVAKGYIFKLGKLASESGAPITMQMSELHQSNIKALAMYYYKNDAGGDVDKAVTLAEKIYLNDRVRPQNRAHIKVNVHKNFTEQEMALANKYAGFMKTDIAKDIESGKIIPSINSLPKAERDQLLKQFPRGEKDPLFHKGLRERVLKYLNTKAFFTADSFDGSANKLYLKANLGTGNFINFIIKNKSGEDVPIELDLNQATRALPASVGDEELTKEIQERIELKGWRGKQ